MRKLVFGLAVLTALVTVSCKRAEVKSNTTVDSTKVVKDTVKADTVRK